MNTPQKEAFIWFLDQAPGDRRARKISDRFKVSLNQAENWLTQFNKMLGEQLDPKISIALKHYVEDYEKVQALTIEGGSIAAELYTKQLREIGKNQGDLDLKGLKDAVNGLKTVYEMTEKASCADVAKHAAKQDSASESPPETPETEILYDMATFAKSLGIDMNEIDEVQPVEN